MFDLPHAQTHAIVLPYVLAFNAPAAPEASGRIAAAFGSADAVTGLAALRQRLDAPRALRDFGMQESGIEKAAAAIVEAAPADNPTPVTIDNITALLRAAWAGDDPRSHA